ncbi:AAA domain-containing protein [Encephalitozoon intestinalis]|nr:AAA domain-containing protein [Encephalitozoon intestinalis]
MRKEAEKDQNGVNGPESSKLNEKLMSGGRLFRVCLTGGPCGGKTTLQISVADMFENMGWHVFRSPEAATILLGGGINLIKRTPLQQKIFQTGVLKVTLQIEDAYNNLARDIAENGGNAVVIYDRGTMDGSAYVTKNDWEEICQEVGMSEVELRDARYDCVIHLVSAADGAEKHYGNGNNITRLEGLKEARLLDKNTSNAWIGHPYLEIIDNSTDFEGKKKRAMETILKHIGMADLRSRDTVKRKFLIKSFDWDSAFPTPFRDLEVRYDYLISSDDGTEIRIRRRGSSGLYVYTAMVRRKREGEVIETRRALTYREYTLLMLKRDPGHNCLIKKRRCFVWKGIYYQLDLFESPYSGLTLLEVYTPKLLDNRSAIPPFICVEREVTEDEDYSMHKLSQVKSSGRH